MEYSIQLNVDTRHMIQMWIYVIFVNWWINGLCKNILAWSVDIYDVDASAIEGGITLKIFVEIYKFTCGNNFFSLKCWPTVVWLGVLKTVVDAQSGTCRCKIWHFQVDHNIRIATEEVSKLDFWSQLIE
jgi:hypothetical protein